MSVDRTTVSPRYTDVLEASYQYALANGIADLPLRPLATAIGSSAGVLIYLFGSKDGLVRALLARAREDELAMLGDLREGDLATVAGQVWRWLADEQHRPVLRLWVEAYATSLINPEGSWAGFAKATVDDWLAVFAAAQPRRTRQSKAGAAQRTLTLAVLRGAMLDLLATGDTDRTTAAVRAQLAGLR
jgi:AcrR family transcriptional regulator